MEHTNQNRRLGTADSDGPKAVLPGGFHGRGVASEVRKRMRVLKVGERSQRISTSQRHTGPTGTAQASAAQLNKAEREARLATGARLAAGGDTEATAVFVMSKRGTDFLDTPAFHAGESGAEESVALFTDRQQAQRYLDRAGWGQIDEVGDLSLRELFQWLVEANGEGIRDVTVNPDRERHLGGDPQPVLSLDTLGGKSPDDLFQKVTDLARG